MRVCVHAHVFCVCVRVRAPENNGFNFTFVSCLHRIMHNIYWQLKTLALLVNAGLFHDFHNSSNSDIDYRIFMRVWSFSLHTHTHTHTARKPKQARFPRSAKAAATATKVLWTRDRSKASQDEMASTGLWQPRACSFERQPCQCC